MAIRTLLFSRSASDNVLVNQAIEAALFESVGEGEAALYIWRNADAVVIGRNQDAFSECRVDALEGAGGVLARRLSGGGAVWHDLGNLNFTFIAREGEFVKERNFRILLSALASLGVQAELSGRNDIMCGGGKCGGNAYYKKGGTELHHGTLLISTSPESVGRYLTPPDAKFEGKGVRSVESRVVALDTVAPGLTAEAAADAIERAFAAEYPDAGRRDVLPLALGADKVMKWTGFFSADDWRYGKRTRRVARAETELFDGRAVVTKDADGKLSVTSDSLDADAVDAVNALLAGESIPDTLNENESNAIRAEAERLRALIGEDESV